jgi:hypothetical protein
MILLRLGNEICALYFPVAGAKFTIVYSHGNAADCGSMWERYVCLAKVLKCNVLGYDYSGYGASTGNDEIFGN